MDLYYTLGSAPCHTVMQIAKLLELELNLIHVNLRGKEHLKPEFLKVIYDVSRSNLENFIKFWPIFADKIIFNL